MADDKLTAMAFEDPRVGKSYTIYSNGIPRTQQEFAAAIDSVYAGRPLPDYSLIEQGTEGHKLREKFEDIITPVLKGSQKADELLGEANRFLLGQRPDVLPSFVTSGVNQARSVIGRPPLGTGQPAPNAPVMETLVNENIRTPARAGLTAGTALVAPFLGPVAQLPREAPVGMELASQPISKMALLRNAAIGGTGAALGGEAGRLAGGEGLNPGKGVLEFFLGGLGASAQSIMSHYLTKYLTPDNASEVASNVFNHIKERYPNIMNDPAFLDRYMEAPQNIERFAAQGAKALRKQAEDLPDIMVRDIQGILPRAFSNTERGVLGEVKDKMRVIVDIGNKMIDNNNDNEAFNAAKDELKQAYQAFSKWLPDRLSKLKGMKPDDARVFAVASQHIRDLAQYTEGAEVLGYLRQAGAEGGWNPLAFAKAIQTKYRGGGNLLEQVGQDVAGGEGKSLTNLPQVYERSDAPEKIVGNIAKRILPGGLGDLLALGTRKRSMDVLPWQIPAQRGRLTGYGAGLTGQDAMRELLKGD